MANKGRILFTSPNLKGAATGRNRIQPPLGPGIMARILHNQGYIAKVHDCALENWRNQINIGDNTIIYGQTDDEIAASISDFNPDIVAISTLFSNLTESAHNIAKIAKQVNPRIKTVLGGNHFSSSVRDYLHARANPNSNMPVRLEDMEDENIDYAMQGECDFEFPKLIYSLLNGQNLSNIQGLVMRKAKKSDKTLEYIINNNPAGILDIKSLPISPLWEPEALEKYFQIGAFHHPYMRVKHKDAEGNSTDEARILPVMASRGCPERCNFCTTSGIWGEKVRWRRVEDILEEIKRGIADYGIEEIQFEDDTLTANKSFLYELCKGLEKIGIPWCTPNGIKANYHTNDSEMYKVMLNGGCYQVTIAGESGVQRTLDELANKKLKVEQIERAIEKAREADLFIHLFGILGFPQTRAVKGQRGYIEPGNPGYPKIFKAETYDEMCESIKKFSTFLFDSMSWAIYNPLPGTPHYWEVIRNNLWWSNRDLSKMKFRNSLIKVDGFSSPEQFEMFVGLQNKIFNNITRKREPKRWADYVGESTNAYQLKVT